MMQLSSLIRNISMNLAGWHTNRKFVVIESDDWGSVRMPSKNVYNKLLSEGLRVDKDVYCKYDSLATPEDLGSLFDVLSSVKDMHGNPAVLTANSVVANPDFEAIKTASFERYFYEPFTATLKRSASTENSFELWKQGMSAGVFRPQFHGREHLYVKKWMNDLRSGYKAVLKGFEYGTFGLSSEVDSSINVDYMGAFNSAIPEDVADFNLILEDGLKMFKDLHGYESRSFIATKYTWPESIEPTLKQSGVLFLQGLVNQYVPVDDDTNFIWKKDNYTGRKSENGLTYIARNAFFEPSIYAKSNTVESCMRRIDIAFKMRKPAVISAHRLNFIGAIDVKNRARNLEMFSLLLNKIVKRYPNVEFVSTDQLGEVISLADNNRRII